MISTAGSGAGPHLAGKRIAVAMSGGVDSSVAAALLVEQGLEVVGVNLKLNDLPDSEKHNKACCSLDDTLDARQVCGRLGIPFYVLDFVEPFGRQVIDYFVQSYAQGRTPNPCVMCNRTIKSRLMLDAVREFGCEYLASGHYAAIRQNPDSGDYEIARPRDRRRDQTYFLAGTGRSALPHLLFPLADLEKPKVRELAEKMGFLSWAKPDSQEVCFVPRDYRDFIAQKSGAGQTRPGEFQDRGGNVLGRHTGLTAYTVGQRRGLGVGGAEPSYVLELDAARNVVVLGREEELDATGLEAVEVNWVSRPAPRAPIQVVAQVRYAHQPATALVEPEGDGRARVTFAQPVRAIAPGQAVAFYDGEVLLGGGWIAAAF